MALKSALFAFVMLVVFAQSNWRESVHPGTLGGALLTDLTGFTIQESYFEENQAQSQGGAIYQSNCTGNLHSHCHDDLSFLVKSPDCWGTLLTTPT